MKMPDSNLRKKVNLLMGFLFIGFFFFFPQPVEAVHLDLSPTELTVTSGQQFTVEVYLDTEGKKVNSAEMSFLYPQNLIWIDKAKFSSLFPLNLQDIRKNEGRATFEFSSSSQETRIDGYGLVMTLTISTHGSGEGYLSFICDGSNDSDDTNIWEAETSSDIIDCHRLKRGNFHIEPKVTELPPQECQLPASPRGLWAESGPGEGQVKLSWNEVEDANYHALVYGLSHGGYIYGAPNIGKTTEYIVSALSPGRTYYFVLTSVNSCGSSGYSIEVLAKAGGELPVGGSTSEKGGWQPSPTPTPSLTPSPTPMLVSPSPVVYSPDEPLFPQPPEEEPEEATISAEVSPEPSETPAGFVPPKQEPFWRDWSFWRKVGILSGILFVLLLVISGLRRAKKLPKPPKKEEFPEKEIAKEEVREEEPIPWSPPTKPQKISQEKKETWLPPTSPQEEIKTTTEEDFKPFSSKSSQEAS